MSTVASYDFDDVPEYFQFKLGGHQYKMRYPTTEELEQAGELEGDERGKKILSYISGVEEATPNVEETLKKVSTKSSQAFLKVIVKEFSATE